MAINALEFESFGAFDDAELLVREAFPAEELGKLHSSVAHPRRLRVKIVGEGCFIRMMVYFCGTETTS